jgi:predicted glycogen debranching enzyme
MSYLNFGKEQLINLEYSLNKEILRANQKGAYLSTTISGCNTRKYHGLLICPVSDLWSDKFVLLSSLDVAVFENGSEFNLGIHRYAGGVYEPKGHIYIREFDFTRIAQTIYQVGGAVLKTETILADNEQQVMIRYTLEDCTLPVKLRLKPFLAFRNIHQLSRANLFVNHKFWKVANGISMKMYENLPQLYMQFSKKTEFVPVPDWYYNIEYQKEKNRGYDFLEDLYVPGYFEVAVKKGESIIFSGSTEEIEPAKLKRKFTTEKSTRPERKTFAQALDYAVKQFILKHNGDTDIVAGYPWYGSITRQTFISLPGLCLSLNDKNTCLAILDTYLKHLREGFFPDQINQKNPVYHSPDSSLWFIWVLGKMMSKTGDAVQLWDKYGKAVKEILQAFKNATLKYVGVTKEGLVFAGKENTPLTWMNSIVDRAPVLQRDGMPIEFNALWYNALNVAVELARNAGDTVFVDAWKGMIKKSGEAFQKTFLNNGHEHLADTVKEGKPDWSVRPNMVIAMAMDYSPLSREQKKIILDVVITDLLTKRGLRTLAPNHLRYRGLVEGSPDEREIAIHQGAVWPWLTQFFTEVYLKIYHKGGLSLLKNLLKEYENDVSEHCLGTISEMYNGNPPHKAKGTISQAWSVASLIYSNHLIQNFTE